MLISFPPTPEAPCHYLLQLQSLASWPRLHRTARKLFSINSFNLGRRPALTTEIGYNSAMLLVVQNLIGTEIKRADSKFAVTLGPRSVPVAVHFGKPYHPPRYRRGAIRDR
jgi:hypothetical protein